MVPLTVLLLLAVSTAAAEIDDLVKTVTVADYDALVREATNPRQKNTKTSNGFSNICPFGWVKLDDRCYIYNSVGLDWASAENYCLNLGANLVSIHNENENQLVKALIRAYDYRENPTWIGLSNCQKRNNWYWSDGTKLSFTKWNQIEPNFNNNECCVHINWDVQKDWNDIPCGQNYPSVCVKRIQRN